MASKFNKILFLTYGGWQHASSRIRALNYIHRLAASSSANIHWLPRAPERGTSIVHQLEFFFVKRYFILRRVLCILLFPWDIIFVQRTFLSEPLLKIIQWRKIPIVYDFDDAIYLGRKSNYHRTLAMITHAKKVVVSSPVLAAFCIRHQIIPEIIPSPVDENIFKGGKKKQKNEKVLTLGWIGSPWTEHYLTAIQSSLQEIASHTAVNVSLMGASKDFKIEHVHLNKVDWRLDKEGDFLSRVDIGIMPLIDDDWSRGKGGYKIYQYMASGIPVVASPIGINSEIVDQGETGFLAENPMEWTRYLMLLIRDKPRREDMGRRGRAKFESNYSYRVCVPLLDKVLKEALNRY